MMRESIKEVLKKELPEANYPEFQPGDLIRVVTMEEIGGQRRQRVFEGVCISRSGAGIDETFKVRKISFGVGVERIFPIHSAVVDEIKIIRKGHVRRAKLNYLAGRSARKSRIKERRVDLDEVNAPKVVEEEIAEPAPEEAEEVTEDVSDASEPQEAAAEEKSEEVAEQQAGEEEQGSEEQEEAKE